jgi:putative membrane protein
MSAALLHPSLPLGLGALGATWALGALALGSWSTHASIPLTLAALLAGYAAAIGPLRERGGWGPPVRWEQWSCFVGGCWVLFASLTGPIHDISDSYLFTAHMVQHLLITLLAPPMLLIGTPDWLVRRALTLRWLALLERALCRPLPAFLLFSGNLALWHLPSFYQATLLRLDVHILQHVLFIGTALIGWWPVLAPARELRPAIAFQLIYLLLLPFPGKAVGMLITMSEDVLYPAYAIAPRIWGISPLADQQIGGILMWEPAGFVFWVTLAAHFFRWFRESRRQELGEDRVVPLVRERVR